MDTDTLIKKGEFQSARVAQVSLAHAVHDTYIAFLPALLPVLIQKFSLTNTAAGLLSVFMQMPSLLQPLIGYLDDRVNLRRLIIFAPAVSGVAMSLLGIAPSYAFLAFLLALAGISSAAFHAVGPVLGSSLAGDKLGRGMSIWMVGGELGRALGPLVTVTAIAFLTLEGLPWLMLAGLLTSIYLNGKLNDLSNRPGTGLEPLDLKTGLKNMRRLMLPMVVIVFTRSMIVGTLMTFLPTFLTSRGASLWVAGISLTILEVSGIAGTLIAGGLSDRFGRRRILMISFVVTPILMVLFVNAVGWMQIPLLVLLGFFFISAIPVLLAIVIENSGESRSLTNGVFMATSFILISLSAFLVGFLSDLFDLRFTFLLSAGILPLGLPFIFLLPKSKKRI